MFVCLVFLLSSPPPPTRIVCAGFVCTLRSCACIPCLNRSIDFVRAFFIVSVDVLRARVHSVFSLDRRRPLFLVFVFDGYPWRTFVPFCSCWNRFKKPSPLSLLFLFFVCLFAFITFYSPLPPISIAHIYFINQRKIQKCFFVFLLTPSLPPSLYNHWTTPCIFRTSLLKNAQNNTSWSDRAEIKRKKNGSRSRFHADEHQKSCKQILFLVFVSPTGKFHWIPIAFPFKKTTSLENHLKITTHYSLQIVICDFDNRWKQEKGVKTDEWRAVFFFDSKSQ